MISYLISYLSRRNLWSAEPWEEGLLTSLCQVTTFGPSASLLKATRGRSFVKTDCCHHTVGVGDLTAGSQVSLAPWITWTTLNKIIGGREELEKEMSVCFPQIL